MDLIAFFSHAMFIRLTLTWPLRPNWYYLWVSGNYKFKKGFRLWYENDSYCGNFGPLKFVYSSFEWSISKLGACDGFLPIWISVVGFREYLLRPVYDLGLSRMSGPGHPRWTEMVRIWLQKLNWNDMGTKFDLVSNLFNFLIFPETLKKITFRSF